MSPVSLELPLEIAEPCEQLLALAGPLRRRADEPILRLHAVAHRGCGAVFVSRLTHDRQLGGLFVFVPPQTQNPRSDRLTQL